MFGILSDPFKGALSLRPVSRSSDRSLIRELFRKEFYGESPQTFSDEGLWAIYDTMETHGVFGAQLAFWRDQPLLLLEVHPLVQMDLDRRRFSGMGAIGAYVFYFIRQHQMNLPVTRACIGALLHDPDVSRIFTTLGYNELSGPKTALLEGTGFRRLTDSSDKPPVYCCTPGSFLLSSLNAPVHKSSPKHILFASPGR
jgi:hypothetical protein